MQQDSKDRLRLKDLVLKVRTVAKATIRFLRVIVGRIRQCNKKRSARAAQLFVLLRPIALLHFGVLVGVVVASA